MLARLRIRVTHVARQPLTHFLALGAVFYGLYAWVGAGRSGEGDKVIRVTVADVSRIEAGCEGFKC